MWNDTVKANCSRDSSNAERSIVRSYRNKLNRLHANTRKVSIVTELLSRDGRTAEVRERRRETLMRNLAITSAAIHCTLVVQDVVMGVLG